GASFAPCETEEQPMGIFREDAVFALRMMRKSPGFTAAAVICLMLGIGATTGIFTVVNAVLLQPLPYSRPERLVRIYTEFPTFPNGGLHRFWSSGPEFLDLRRDAHSWATLDAWIEGGANLAGKTQPVRVTAAYVSGTLLETLGVDPIKGRLIGAADDVKGAPAVADISYGTWQSVSPGDPDPASLWTALQLDPANPGNRGSHNYYLLGRLKDGVTPSQAQAELAALVQTY